MATKTPQNGKTLGGYNPTAATAIHGQHPSSAEKQTQALSTLHATSVLKGSALQPDSLVSFLAERWDLVQYLPTIDTARRLFEQVGGRL